LKRHEIEMKSLLNIASVLAFCASAISGQAALKYRVLAITPGSAQGVNDKGDVVGTLTLPNPPPIPEGQGPTVPRAFLYKGGKITNLGAFYTPSAPTEYGTTGAAVNNSDVVAGNILNDGGNDGGAGAFDAFIWKNGVMTDIAQGTSDGGQSAFAVGINEQGEAVGTYDAVVILHIPPFGFPHAYVSLNGVRTDLGTLAGENTNYSFGYGINNAGQVVGVSSNTTNGFGGGTYAPIGTLWYAFLWTNGTMKAIGGIQSANFSPAAINDNGWIAGTLGGQAVLYVNSRFIPLGAVKGFPFSQGLSMNNLGMVVGNLEGAATPSVFVYDGVMHDLNTLVDGGWTITTVGKINIFGQIAATGTRSGSTTTYALLLTPSLF
jgi:probable HAF family extracellular repeat protein